MTQCIVTYDSRNADHSPMYPGRWVETWGLSCGVWWLLNRSPYLENAP